MSKRRDHQVLTALARADPVIRDVHVPGVCVLCNCYQRHAETCPWQRAREVTGIGVRPARRSQPSRTDS